MTGGNVQKKTFKAAAADKPGEKVNNDQNSKVYLGLEDLKRELKSPTDTVAK